MADKQVHEVVSGNLNPNQDKLLVSNSIDDSRSVSWASALAEIVVSLKTPFIGLEEITSRNATAGSIIKFINIGTLNVARLEYYNHTAVLSQSDYAELFAVYSTNPNVQIFTGTNEFSLPNLSNRVDRELGDLSGTSVGEFQDDALQDHFHKTDPLRTGAGGTFFGGTGGNMGTSNATKGVLEARVADETRVKSTTKQTFILAKVTKLV